MEPISRDIDINYQVFNDTYYLELDNQENSYTKYIQMGIEISKKGRLSEIMSK